ncbi:hypothetical protein V8E36_008557 [Tilletia maclaganii]
MPRFTPAPAPKCPRCGDSIFATELKIGPNATPYHARCLTCKLCNKRLDSSLLLEHEGEPYCKHCHAKLLGTGANGFTRAVPLQPRSPEAAGVKVNAFSSPHSPATGVPSASPASALGHGHGQAQGQARAYAESPSTRHRTTSSVSSAASGSSRAGLGTSGGAIGQSSPHARAIDDAVGRSSTPIYTSSAAKRGPVSTGAVAGQSSYTRSNQASDDYDEEFGPVPIPTTSAQQHFQSQPAQSMDELVNQVHHIFIRPRGAAIVPTPLTESDRYDGGSYTSSPSHTPLTHESDAGDSASLVSDSALTTATVGAPSGSLPPPKRMMPSKHGPGAGAGLGYKTAPAYGGGTSGLSRLGLESSISAASGGGTPLCARCSKPVYFAEQKQGAGRKWHRACLRCDGCSTILESGRLEEGPADGAELAARLNPAGGLGANIWCRNCYAKHFGPKGIGVGMSVPEGLRR